LLHPQIIDSRDFPPKISQINILQRHPSRKPLIPKIKGKKQGRRAPYLRSLKSTVTTVATSIGRSFTVYGRYRLALTARTAAPRSSLCPLIACALITRPLFPTTASTVTFPCVRVISAIIGYDGGGAYTRRAAITAGDAPIVAGAMYFGS
jgi:hypothetical protein